MRPLNSFSHFNVCMCFGGLVTAGELFLHANLSQWFAASLQAGGKFLRVKGRALLFLLEGWGKVAGRDLCFRVNYKKYFGFHAR